MALHRAGILATRKRMHLVEPCACASTHTCTRCGQLMAHFAPRVRAFLIDPPRDWMTAMGYDDHMEFSRACEAWKVCVRRHCAQRRKAAD